MNGALETCIGLSESIDLAPSLLLYGMLDDGLPYEPKKTKLYLVPSSTPDDFDGQK